MTKEDWTEEDKEKEETAKKRKVREETDKVGQMEKVDTEDDQKKKKKKKNKETSSLVATAHKKFKCNMWKDANKIEWMASYGVGLYLDTPLTGRPPNIAVRCNDDGSIDVAKYTLVKKDGERDYGWSGTLTYQLILQDCRHIEGADLIVRYQKKGGGGDGVQLNRALIKIRVKDMSEKAAIFVMPCEGEETMTFQYSYYCNPEW